MPTTYDLAAPAHLIVPVAAPLVNSLPRHPVKLDFPTCQTLSLSITGFLPGEVTETMRHHLFCELLYALKLAEQGWLLMRLSEDRMYGEIHDAVRADPIDLDLLQDRVKVLVAEGYTGTEEVGADGQRIYTVSVKIGISVRFPLHELTIPAPATA